MTDLRNAIWFGQGRTSGTPTYWEGGAIAVDAGTDIALVARTAMLYPQGRSGETLFRMAYLSVTHVASAVLRVTPVVEGTLGVLSVATGTLTPTPQMLTLPQQTGEPRTAVYPVPLVAKYQRSGGPLTRVSLRGVGVQLLIESVGAIGNGMLAIDAVEVEHEPIAKAQFEGVTS